MAVYSDPLFEGITKPAKMAVLHVSLEAIQHALYVPEGYQFVSATYDVRSRLLKFLVTSESLPEVKEGYLLPEIGLHISMEWMPEDHSFRRYTAEVKL